MKYVGSMLLKGSQLQLQALFKIHCLCLCWSRSRLPEHGVRWKPAVLRCRREKPCRSLHLEHGLEPGPEAEQLMQSGPMSSVCPLCPPRPSEWEQSLMTAVTSSAETPFPLEVPKDSDAFIFRNVTALVCLATDSFWNANNSRICHPSVLYSWTAAPAFPL